MTKADFFAASKLRTGSRDLGAQLFCALLRSVGVTCRLVCSLQPLPLSSANKAVPGKPRPTDGPQQSGYVGGSRRGDARLPDDDSNVFLSESKFPIFWVEAWSTGAKRWIAVDPHATLTVGKPSAFEPPMSDPGNAMCYVVAFEEG
jgi:xeroderma pigmentosum group C-complementing protein